MEYITRNCPNCNRELQVPADLKNCICMYCGESFQTQEDKPAAVTEVERLALEADYHKALENIRLLWNDYEKLLIQFNRNKYAACFEEYEQSCIPVLRPAHEFASLSEQQVQQVADEIARIVVESMEKDIDERSIKKKTPKSTIIDQFRFYLTVYLVPMIRHLNYNFSEAFADSIIEIWTQKYPKYPFQKSEYDRLLSGFNRKGLCFITTAVCLNLGKKDDCYELMAFREFRDTYMQETPDRKTLIEEYYQIAPVVVTSIDMRPNAVGIYQEIWENYLQPCLKALEDNRQRDCLDQYSKMVKELRHRYHVETT